MPFVIVTGYPCSGKSTRSQELKHYLENVCNKKVHLLSEEDVLSQCYTDKNKVCFDSRKQKEIRAILKNNVTRLLGPDVTILDASNNIKGFRYELYCATKCHKTTQCVIECAVSEQKAYELNELRDDNEKYTPAALQALIALYEPVNNCNRWDSPLVTINLDDELPGSKISSLLFEQHAPKPNLSTQNVPLCSSTYLSDLDKVTKEVINTILVLQNDGLHGKKVKLPNIDAELDLLDERFTSRKLLNLKHQFISYCKLNPLANSQDNVAKLFVQFINSSS